LAAPFSLPSFGGLSGFGFCLPPFGLCDGFGAGFGAGFGFGFGFCTYWGGTAVIGTWGN
jgi:hypothetical protein